MKFSPNYLQRLGKLSLLACVFIQSCDHLDEEIVPERENQVIKVNYDDVFILSKNSGFVDITQGISSNKPVSATIIENPDKGDLVSLGQGVYAYNPTESFTKGLDQIRVRISSEDGAVSAEGTIDVIVTDNEEELPCNYYALNETATIDQEGQSFEIDVLANDIDCALHKADPSTLKVLYHTSNGTASVVDGKIRFDHDPLMPFYGSIFYTVNLEGCSECTRPAYVTLLPPAPENCTETILNADRMTLVTVGPVTFNNEYTYTRLRVMNNDVFCGSDADATKQLSILHGPSFGTAEVDVAGELIKYWMPLNITIDLSDTITYQVCLEGKCLKQMIVLSVRFDPYCALAASTDQFDLNQLAEEGGKYTLDITANDEMCQLSQFTDIRIAQMPSTGSVDVVEGKVIYSHDASTIADSFKYALCTSNGYCSGPTVVKIVK